LKRTPL